MNTQQLDQYAVFGNPISHSKSPLIHHLFAEQTGEQLEYSAQQVTTEDFSAAVSQFLSAGGKGLNCTVPLKELAWQHADQVSERAQAAKAVNTLKLMPDGNIFGDNTDGAGLVRDLCINHAIKLSDAKILILGAGGASRGILMPLLAKQAKHIVLANRSLDKAEALVAEFNNDRLSACSFQELQDPFDLIINATSASLSGELPPLPADIINNNTSCYDLAYADQDTTFVAWAKSKQAAKSLNGLGMLVEQAAEAFYIWRNVYPDTAAVIQRLNSKRQTF